jgi:hypothetical protein
MCIAMYIISIRALFKKKCLQSIQLPPHITSIILPLDLEGFANQNHGWTMHNLFLLSMSMLLYSSHVLNQRTVLVKYLKYQQI